ncbi:MAG: hypothetical protein JJU46_03165 [Balneolaceae bacterium]|nr:hypothetical protein [Balneolaceae bacterium]MCH8548333.1 hypothetical protein [Balneolaceae bacterium]
MVSEKSIKELITKNGKELVTITLPTHKKGEESKQDPIRFKNLISKATEILKARGKKEAEAEAYLKPAKDLLERPMFWSHADHGLAIYLNDEGFNVYKLPYSVEEQVYVNDHHLVTPLLPMLSMDGRFTVLALSRQKMRLLECTRNEVTDITPEGVSTSVEDYLEVDPEKQLQFHSGAKGQKAMYFGHGASEEDRKIVVEQFFREFEKAATTKLRVNGDPVVLIGLPDNVSLYKKVNNYSRAIDQHIDHNPDELSDKKLRDKGWELIQEHFLKDMYSSLESFTTRGEGKVSNNLSEIVEATVMGRSQAVFISRGESKWGHYDEDNQTVHFSTEPRNGDVELLNWLSITAHKQGSKVFILPKEEMPMKSMVAASYRF